jgi:DNA-binding NarL/FixJ family response regulator
MISDLSFKNDGTPQQLKSGEELIGKVRIEFPDLKIIVFSVDDKPFRIQHLYKNLKIQGYVWKNRNGLKELKTAMQSIFSTNEFYISPDLNSAIHPKKAIEITDFDVFLISSLSNGFLQEAISKKLKEKGIQPSSTSAIEKRLKILKEHFNAKNPAHLVAIAKDFGLI